MTVSLMAFMSTSMPRSGAAVDGEPASLALDVQPICSRTSTNARRLAGCLIEARDGDAPAGDRGGGEEVARRRGVRLDLVHDAAGRLLPAGDVETRSVARGVDVSAELPRIIRSVMST